MGTFRKNKNEINDIAENIKKQQTTTSKNQYNEIEYKIDEVETEETNTDNQITLDDLKNMSKEDMDKLIKKDSNTIKELISEKEKELKEAEEIQNKYKWNGVGNNPHLEEYKQASNEVARIKNEIHALKEQNKMLKYNYIQYKSDYINFTPKTDKVDEEDIKANTTSSFNTGTAKTEKKFDYMKYSKEHNLNPFDVVKASGDAATGKNAEELKNLVKASELSPDLEKMYKYIYETQGEKAATKYLKDSKDLVNQILGQKQAQEFMNSLTEGDDFGKKTLDHVNVTGKGLDDGLKNFEAGIKAWAESSDVYSIDEYEKMYLGQALQERGYGLDINYNISTSVGNMLPSIIISSIPGCQGFAATAISAAGTITMGVSAGGNSYHSSLVEGYDKQTAAMYGIATGASEAILEKALGGLPGVGSNADLGKFLAKAGIVGEIGATKAMASFIGEMGKEGFEEGIQEIIDQGVFRRSILGEDVDIKQMLKDAGISAAYGAATAGIMQAPGAAINIKNNARSHSAIDINENPGLNFFKSEKSDSGQEFFRTPSPEDLSTPDSITSPKNSKEIIDNIIKSMDNKYGEGRGIANIEEYLKTGNESLITRDNGARQSLSKISNNDILNYLLNIDLNIGGDANVNLQYFFDSIQGEYGYGVDQGVIESLCTYKLNGKEYTYRQATDIINKAIENNEVLPHFKKIGNEEYFALKNKIIDMGFSNSEASVIMSSLNDAGACSYASTCNEIFYKFRNNPELFEQIFGYSMYKETNNGLSLNSTELLLDLFLHVNDQQNGGYLFRNGSIDTRYLGNKVDVFGRRIIDVGPNQQYMSRGGNYGGKSVDTINRFLQSKSSDLNFESETYINNWNKTNYSKAEFDYIVNGLKEELNKGRQLTMDYFYHGPGDTDITMHSLTEGVANMKTSNWHEGGGHSVAITGIDSDGFIVSSWGNKYKIKFSDLRQGGRFLVYSSDIKFGQSSKTYNNSSSTNNMFYTPNSLKTTFGDIASIFGIKKDTNEQNYFKKAGDLSKDEQNYFKKAGDLSTDGIFDDVIDSNKDKLGNQKSAFEDLDSIFGTNEYNKGQEFFKTPSLDELDSIIESEIDKLDKIISELDEFEEQIHSDNNNGKKIDYTGYKEYDYDEFYLHYSEKQADWYDNLPEEIKDLFGNYLAENELDIGNYKAINAILRGIFINESGQIAFRDSFGGIDSYSIKTFEQLSGMSIDEFIQKQKAAADKMKDAMSRMKLDEKAIIYRGVNWDALTGLKGPDGKNLGIKETDSAEVIYQKLMQAGGEYSDSGFMSSSPDPVGITSSKDIIFKIKCDEGTSGIDMKDLGGFENEFLFAPDSKFDIEGVTKKNGKIYIHLKTK